MQKSETIGKCKGPEVEQSHCVKEQQDHSG